MRDERWILDGVEGEGARRREEEDKSRAGKERGPSAVQDGFG